MQTITDLSEKEWNYLKGLSEKYGYHYQHHPLSYFYECINMGENYAVPFSKKNNYIIIDGDPLCLPGSLQEVIYKLENFADENNSLLSYIYITENFAQILEKKGYHVFLMGHEATVDFKNFDFALKGGRYKNLRNEIIFGEKNNIVVEALSEDAREEVCFVSSEWEKEKNRYSNLNFFLENYQDYQVSLPDVVVHVAQANKKIYNFAIGHKTPKSTEFYLSLIRRSNNGIRGANEIVLFNLMKHALSRGYPSFNFGLVSPENFGQLEEIGKDWFPEYKKTLFSLNLFKKKFNPTIFVPAYIAFREFPTEENFRTFEGIL